MPAAGAKKPTPSPARQRATPPAGHRVNVRSDPHGLDPNQIVDRLSDGMLFVAFQRLDGGAKPPGASSVWYGNEDGSGWIHESGLRQIARPTTTPPPCTTMSAADAGDEDINIGTDLAHVLHLYHN